MKNLNYRLACNPRHYTTVGGHPTAGGPFLLIDREEEGAYLFPQPVRFGDDNAGPSRSIEAVSLRTGRRGWLHFDLPSRPVSVEIMVRSLATA